eukprot:2449739-Prymnesium_polylepis.1
MDGSCVQSSGYPSPYGYNEECTIGNVPSSPVTIIEFDVDGTYDTGDLTGPVPSPAAGGQAGKSAGGSNSVVDSVVDSVTDSVVDSIFGRRMQTAACIYDHFHIDGHDVCGLLASGVVSDVSSSSGIIIWISDGYDHNSSSAKRWKLCWTADPPSAPAPPSLLSSTGPCLVVGDCVRSFGYPSTIYGNSEACSISGVPASPIIVNAFDVEAHP